MTCPKWLRQLLTGQDGTTLDLGRVSWIVTQLAILLAATGNYVHASIINLWELGGALGANTALHGAAIGFKASTEPPRQPEGQSSYQPSTPSNDGDQPRQPI